MICVLNHLCKYTYYSCTIVYCNSQDDFNNIGIDWDGPVPVITDRQQNAVVVPETTCVLPPLSQEEFTRTINPLRDSEFFGIDIYIEAVILLQNLLQNQEI